MHSEPKDQPRELLRFDDAIQKDDDDRHPDLWKRWPEPRVFDQAQVWIEDDLATFRLDDLYPEVLRLLLAYLYGNVELWHRAAAADELARLSSATGWAYRNAGVPLIGNVDPVSWLESTVLVRRIRSLLAAAEDEAR